MRELYKRRLPHHHYLAITRKCDLQNLYRAISSILAWSCAHLLFRTLSARSWGISFQSRLQDVYHAFQYE